MGFNEDAVPGLASHTKVNLQPVTHFRDLCGDFWHPLRPLFTPPASGTPTWPRPAFWFRALDYHEICFPLPFAFLFHLKFHKPTMASRNLCVVSPRDSHLCSIMMWVCSSANDGLPFVPNQGHYKDRLRKRVREYQAAYLGVAMNERCF